MKDSSSGAAIIQIRQGGRPLNSRYEARKKGEGHFVGCGAHVASRRRTAPNRTKQSFFHYLVVQLQGCCCCQRQTESRLGGPDGMLAVLTSAGVGGLVEAELGAGLIQCSTFLWHLSPPETRLPQDATAAATTLGFYASPHIPHKLNICGKGGGVGWWGGMCGVE